MKKDTDEQEQLKNVNLLLHHAYYDRINNT